MYCRKSLVILYAIAIPLMLIGPIGDAYTAVPVIMVGYCKAEDVRIPNMFSKFELDRNERIYRAFCSELYALYLASISTFKKLNYRFKLL